MTVMIALSHLLIDLNGKFDDYSTEPGILICAMI